MAWTVDTFLARYPHLAEISGARKSGVIASALAEAAHYCDATVWGGKYDHGVGLMACHLLSVQPFWDGKPSSVVTKDGRTPYLDQYERMAQVVGRGAGRVVLFEDES